MLLRDVEQIRMHSLFASVCIENLFLDSCRQVEFEGAAGIKECQPDFAQHVIKHGEGELKLHVGHVVRLDWDVHL